MQYWRLILTPEIEAGCEITDHAITRGRFIEFVRSSGFLDTGNNATNSILGPKNVRNDKVLV